MTATGKRKRKRIFFAPVGFSRTKETDMQSTREVVDQLRIEGYDIRPSYLSYLLRDGIIPSPMRVGQSLVWDDVHVDALRAELRRRGRYAPNVNVDQGTRG